MEPMFTPRKLVFHLSENDTRDIYNTTAPFFYQGTLLLVARVEDRPLHNAEACFFQKENDEWIRAKDFPSFYMEDPFYKKIGKEHILGGVIVEDETYSTVFMKAPEDDLQKLTIFAKGPPGMKDIRLVELENEQILVFTRPQKGHYGRGKIGYVLLNSLEELTAENILLATILSPQFSQEEWGGVNECHLLRDGSIGLLAHIACYGDKNHRHYAATTFRFSLKDHTFTPMEILAERTYFLDGPAKRPDLTDVVFPSGLIRNIEEGTVTLFAGTSDAEEQELTLPDPFRKWE